MPTLTCSSSQYGVAIGCVTSHTPYLAPWEYKLEASKSWLRHDILPAKNDYESISYSALQINVVSFTCTTLQLSIKVVYYKLSKAWACTILALEYPLVGISFACARDNDHDIWRQSRRYRKGMCTICNYKVSSGQTARENAATTIKVPYH